MQTPSDRIYCTEVFIRFRAQKPAIRITLGDAPTFCQMIQACDDGKALTLLFTDKQDVPRQVYNWPMEVIESYELLGCPGEPEKA